MRLSRLWFLTQKPQLLGFACAVKGQTKMTLPAPTHFIKKTFRRIFRRPESDKEQSRCVTTLGCRSLRAVSLDGDPALTVGTEGDHSDRHLRNVDFPFFDPHRPIKIDIVLETRSLCALLATLWNPLRLAFREWNGPDGLGFASHYLSKV